MPDRIANSPQPTRRRRAPRESGALAGRLALLGGLACAAALLLAVTAPAAGAAPALDVRPTHYPTHIPPGGEGVLVVGVENIGDAETDPEDPIQVDIQLPAGMSAVEADGTLDFGFPSSLDWGCEVSGAEERDVSCTYDPFGFMSFFEGATYLPHDEGCGNQCTIKVTVAVDPEASTGTATMTACGGGGQECESGEEATGAETLTVDAEPAAAGVQSLEWEILTEGGEPAAQQAGARPWAMRMWATFNSVLNEGAEDFLYPGTPPRPVDWVKTVRFRLPPGVIGDPTAVPTCTRQEFTEELFGYECPKNSQVGTLKVEIGGFGELEAPLNSIVAPPGVAAQYGADLFGLVQVFSTIVVTPDGGHLVKVTTRRAAQVIPLQGVEITLWGVPTDSSYDFQRWKCLNADGFRGTPCPAEGEPEPVPFLTNPTDCSAAERIGTLMVDGWAEPGVFDVASDEVYPGGLVGCDELEFDPRLRAVPTTNVADSPTGLDVDLRIPQAEKKPDVLATPHLKDAEVTLPRGLVVSPAGANGLAACSSAQIGLVSKNPVRFDNSSPSCPQASKIGKVEVSTPLLSEPPLPGFIYVAAQGDNPFDSTLAIYVVVEDSERGVLIKLAGHVQPDPRTGQITTVFADNPQLPFDEFDLEFFGGAAAPLRTPSFCGTYAAVSRLTPWSAPGSGPPAVSASAFEIAQGPSGDCANIFDTLPPHEPDFDAGSVRPLAGHYSPFVVNLRRQDGSQRFAAVEVSPPPGLVAKLADTPFCPNSALAAAAGREGADEQADPSCPAASRVGDVVVAVGAGPAPYWTRGTAYLAGPHEGAPLSLAIVTPAVAGPFDLGTIVVRTALHVDPRTAAITAVSDRLPRILEGIPLDIRTVSIQLDKPEFTRNPTSCEETSVDGELLSVFGRTASLSSRFQLGECRRMDFEPRLALRLFGGVRRTAHPALRAVLAPQADDANISSAVVALPRSEILDQGNIGTVCTRVQFAADACPARSAYGRAAAVSPLLEEPLRGPVYLRSSDNELPDLVADLRGRIDIEVVGRLDSVKGGIRTTFEVVPDAPVSRFVLQMVGGKQQGLLVNSRNICARAYRANARLTAHNGRRAELQPALRNARCKGQRRKTSRRARQAASKRRAAISAARRSG